ncbi:MAG: lipopolysaccharide transport periplasmic protein LptA [Rubrivivax sp.]|nr:lipopolysaccharide transport periplasmic protein LptA [Rubrivivax sp.]MBK7264112.1 lipopolysaccharide transport periplasmic protein LptA [Rubrivivax sp.]MBK8525744.1 lipopolysaccharide transport periplasmic protein LptA [Rubrivivax sp.]
MTSFLHPIFLALLLVVVAAPAAAEKADRGKPMEILADKSGSADLKNQVSRFSGNVVITQGTMVITADRVEVRQTPDGYHTGTAWGLPGVPVTYRQKRDNVDEYVEGAADRVEFDGKTEVLRFIGNSVVRRLRGKEVIDEITGALIVWNHASEQFSVQGAAPVGSGPAGRARAVFTPPAGSAAASTPAGGKTGAGPR